MSKTEENVIEFANPDTYTGAGIWAIVKGTVKARRRVNPASKISQEECYAAIKHFIGEPISEENAACIEDRLNAIPDEPVE